MGKCGAADVISEKLLQPVQLFCEGFFFFFRGVGVGGCFFSLFLRLSCFNLQERFSAYELWRMWVQLWVPQGRVRLIQVSLSTCISEEAVTWYDYGVKEFLMWSRLLWIRARYAPLGLANSLSSSSLAKTAQQCAIEHSKLCKIRQH